LHKQKCHLTHCNFIRRFISIVKSDNFDYTEWQRDLWKDRSIDEIHQMATAFEARNS
jgi:hypothetical protein